MERDSVQDQSILHIDTDKIHLDLVPTLSESRTKIVAALVSQTALMASYVHELLAYERVCLETLENPEHAQEHPQRRRQLDQLRRDLPDWRKAFWLLTGKRIGLPHSTEELRDAEGRTTWVLEYDESGYGTTVFHAEYDDWNTDLDIHGHKI